MTELRGDQIDQKVATKVNRRQFLKMAGAGVGALVLSRVPGVEAGMKAPSNPEWALDYGEVLGTSIDKSTGIQTETTLTLQGKNIGYFDSMGERYMMISGPERARYFRKDEMVDTGDVDRVQDLTEGNDGLLIMKMARKAGENESQFKIRRASWKEGQETKLESVDIHPVHPDGEILDVLGVSPWQLAVLERTVSSYVSAGGAPLEAMVVRRLIRQKANYWKNVSAASEDFGYKDMPFVKFFSVVKDTNHPHYQDVVLGLKNGILTVHHEERWSGEEKYTDREEFIGPKLKQANSRYDLTGRLSNYPLDYDNFVAFVPNFKTGGYNLAVRKIDDRHHVEPIIEWGSIGIEGAEPVSGGAWIYDKDRKNALCPFTYKDHDDKVAFALFHLSWDKLPMGEAVGHHVTDKAFGFLPNGGEITGVAGFREGTGTGQFEKKTLVDLVVTKGNDSTIHSVPLDKN